MLSLKLSIQCAKLLGDTTQPRYYPSMFCYVTDVLESFGKMVFDRIKVRSRQLSASRFSIMASIPPLVVLIGTYVLPFGVMVIDSSNR